MTHCPNCAADLWGKHIDKGPGTTHHAQDDCHPDNYVVDHEARTIIADLFIAGKSNRSFKEASSDAEAKLRAFLSRRDAEHKAALLKEFSVNRFLESDDAFLRAMGAGIREAIARVYGGEV